MAALADIFAAVRLQLDTPGFQAEAAAAGDKAGKSAGAKMSEGLNNQLKTKLKGAIFAGLGAGLAAASKLGMELNETLTDVQARTGAVGAEWDTMSATIQKKNRDTTLSLQEIGDGVAALKSDLGLAADEIDMAADKLTDFGLVAREVFADSVRGADDLKDAFNLTLAEVFVVLDTLVASQQKYGGVITENRAALVALAPALIAANLSWREGNELINLANASGIDAATMVTALTKALGKIKTPDELRTLIADIQTTPDDFARTQKAIDLFGAKAGPKLALALAPGKGALEDYGFTAEETAGRVDAAAEKINSSWNRRIALATENVTGFLAEIGNATGPVLGTIASLATTLTGLDILAPGKISGLMGKIGLGRGQSPASPLFTSDVGLGGAAGAAGKAGLLGKLMGLIPAATIAAALIAVAVPIGEAFRDALPAELKGPGGKGESESQRRIREGREAEAARVLQGRTTADVLMAGLRPDERGPRTAAPGAWTSGWSRGLDKLHEDLVKAIETIKTSNDPKAVADALAAVLKSILGGEGNAAQTRALVAELTAKRDAALARGDTATAQAFANAIAKIEPLAKGRQWQAEQLDKAQKIVDSNKSTAEKVASLKGIQQDLLSHNRTMAAGIIGKLIDVETAVKGIKVNVSTGFSMTGPYSKPPKPGAPKPPAKPPAKEINWQSPDRWAAGGHFRPRRPMIVGELRPELLIPDVGGEIVPRVPSGMDGGNTYNVTVEGLVQARDPFEIAEAQRRVSSFLSLSRQRQPA